MKLYNIKKYNYNKNEPDQLVMSAECKYYGFHCFCSLYTYKNDIYTRALKKDVMKIKYCGKYKVKNKNYIYECNDCSFGDINLLDFMEFCANENYKKYKEKRLQI